ncbi:MULTISPECIES: DUF2866 domain-containing protein [Caballeronia]|jgi:hypothetical protein|uniref:DUF2866 domain-containing protein n=1 Tax=Caballeronia zhejiangensis TaxID=871203 RepID=A0A656QMZ3_9BURK|nr:MULTISPECIES: DUF2866 domain-containing protein [Caballeronia]EKS67114.1 hypothetical protein BURK_034749 [Burkholderia sp. SJ98]KDR30344.1 hypothetical protein BG60_37500 [Caballeronia zhejiangensis]MCG7404349.1 DUF2866 domain-containing protein [Caballeronia zhejiangensis]MCI1045889.1 DUF2866 domain-containing protein [Caballeronia zhejiangensis]MDR5769171.1 DUF2866 domain-containing protein [Caballeronia sp. LZ028]
MPANTAARRSFANLAPTMRKQYALTLRECRLSLPVEPPWGAPYRMVEWASKTDQRVQRRVFPADCTPSQIADALKSHVPGRRYGPTDDED